MKTKIAILVLMLSSAMAMDAQNARTILDNANKAYTNAGVVNVGFTINTEDVKNKTTYSQDGKANLKGNKFRIDILDGTTWFDGSTQWVYVKGSEEVNISNPTGEELAAVSPAALLNIYKKGFKLTYKGEVKESGKTAYSIELVPENKSSEFNKMIVNIDKTTNLFTSIKMFMKNGMNSHLLVKSLKTNISLPDNAFVFNKKDYPKVEIIDLR